MESSYNRIGVPVTIWDLVTEFIYRIWGAVNVKGWRKRDKVVWLATIFVHIVLAPVRFPLSSSMLLSGILREKVMRWVGRLETLGYTPLFDCVLLNNPGVLIKLRGGIDDTRFACSNFEAPIVNAFQPKMGETVVDIGAHIGLYTLKASHLVGSTGKVIAIEAEPSNFAALKYNLQLNQASNVTPMQLAAWDNETTLDLHISQINKATHSLVFAPSGDNKFVTRVIANRVDKVLEELGIEKIDWVKIDVEGAEFRVLRGLKKTIRRNSGLKILVEVHSEETLAQCLSILQKPGYEIHSLDNYHIFATPVVFKENNLSDSGVVYSLNDNGTGTIIE